MGQRNFLTRSKSCKSGIACCWLAWAQRLSMKTHFISHSMVHENHDTNNCCNCFVKAVNTPTMFYFFLQRCPRSSIEKPLRDEEKRRKRKRKGKEEKGTKGKEEKRTKMKGNEGRERKSQETNVWLRPYSQPPDNTILTKIAPKFSEAQISIDVKNVFYVFYSCHVFYVF